MGFLAGATVGLGILFVLRAWNNPQPLRIPPLFYPFTGSALIGALVGFFLLDSIAVALCGAFMGGAIYSQIRSTSIQRRVRAQRETWPDVLDDIVASLRAGLSVSQALAKIGERGPQLMQDPFARCAQAVRAHGRIDLAIDFLKDEFRDPLADRVLEAMRLSHELGDVT